MNKFVSVPSEPQPQKSPETPPPSAPITSLEAMASVNAQESLSTEMLFKTLLVYYKPDQGWFETPSDLPSLTAAINKGASSQGTVSEETQKNISEAIMISQFDTPLLTEVARAIATNLGTFTATEAQKHLSWAIYDGKFGNPIPEDVALAIVSNLAKFKDRDAQQIIALAIYREQFGNPIPQDVALALAANLDTFTERDAQKNIALAICNGQFGTPIPPDVALAIATKLGTFTAPEAQKYLSWAIYDGKFGNPIPEDVALAIVLRIDTFKEPEAQRNIALAIRSGTFGNPTIPQDVALLLVSKLDTFKEEDAQKNIALAICSGKFGTPIPSEVALAIAAKLNIFTAPEAQQNIALALRFSILTQGSEAIPQAIQKSLESLTDVTIASAIYDGKFGDPIPPDVALAIVSKLDTFRSEEAQRNIALAIYNGKFGNPIRQNVALALVSKLDTFTEEYAQKDIALAICNGTFGKPISPEVALAIATKVIASKLSLSMFKDPVPQEVALAIVSKLDRVTAKEAQQDISAAIRSGRFGAPIQQEVALALAAKLDTFRSEAAQRNIASAIYNGKFGTTLQTLPPEGKAAIMSFLKKVSLREAIKNFDRLSVLMGESPEFKQSALQAVALPSVRAYTEAETVLQQYEAVKNLATGVAKFNCDAHRSTLPTAFSSIALNLAAVLRSPPAAIATCFPGFQALIDGTQSFKGLIDSLAAAITEKEALLSGDSATDADELAASQRIIDSAVATVKDCNRSAFASTDLGKLEAAITTAAAKLADLKPILASELASQLRPVPFGAQTVPMTSQTIAHLSGLAQVDLRDIFEDGKQMTYLLYGSLLLTYDCSTPDAREKFQGWLSDHPVFYKATAQNVNVYDVSGESPVLLDIRDAQHTSFPDLPLFMCKAITDCSFDITAYRHSAELDLIFGEAGILTMLRSQYAADPAKLALIDKMQSIIQTCIALEGDSVSIAASTADDQALKDDMNQLCPIEIKTTDPFAKFAPFIEKLEHFLAGIGGSPLEKEATYSRLGFLFGQLAKKGVLGYHHGSKNTANKLFYTLSATCFRKLSSLTLPERDLQTLLNKLNGECIEQITNSFLSQHGAVAEIWRRG